MGTQPGIAEAAALFKALGNPSRLGLLHLIGQQARTVGALAAASGLSQPLVSQHLRTLRHVGLVTAARDGKEVVYSLADEHVRHVIGDAIAHTQEPVAPATGDNSPTPRSEP